jgi:predicted enzyme related to lactoylglutathione lyase
MKARRISAVLCSGDLSQSQTFYEQVVGLTLSADTISNHLLFECGDGTTVLVYGRPGPNKADHTQVRFWTDDIESDVRELESRGAVFEDYDFPTLKTVDHVATRPQASASPPGSRTPTETHSHSFSPSSCFKRIRLARTHRCAPVMLLCLSSSDWRSVFE